MVEINEAQRSRRYDGGTNQDPWAAAHQYAGPNNDGAGRSIYMQDLDGVFGVLNFADKSECRLFVEYVPNNRVDLPKVQREFGIVALFDRKKRIFLPDDFESLKTGLYLHLCRMARSIQGEDCAPKFFFVIGENEPWEIRELNIDNGMQVQMFKHSNGEFKQTWQSLGLYEIRSRLQAKLNARANASKPVTGLDKFQVKIKS